MAGHASWQGMSLARVLSEVVRQGCPTTGPSAHFVENRFLTTLFLPALFLAALLATQKLKAKYPDTCIEIGMAG